MNNPFSSLNKLLAILLHCFFLPLSAMEVNLEDSPYYQKERDCGYYLKSVLNQLAPYSSTIQNAIQDSSPFDNSSLMKTLPFTKEELKFLLPRLLEQCISYNPLISPQALSNHSSSQEIKNIIRAISFFNINPEGKEVYQKHLILSLGQIIKSKDPLSLIEDKDSDQIINAIRDSICTANFSYRFIPIEKSKKHQRDSYTLSFEGQFLSLSKITAELSTQLMGHNSFDILTLDLSDNLITKISNKHIKDWQKKFPNLRKIILTGNPLNEKTRFFLKYPSSIILRSWKPTLILPALFIPVLSTQRGKWDGIIRLGAVIKFPPVPGIPPRRPRPPVLHDQVWLLKYIITLYCKDYFQQDAWRLANLASLLCGAFSFSSSTQRGAILTTSNCLLGILLSPLVPGWIALECFPSRTKHISKYIHPIPCTFVEGSFHLFIAPQAFYWLGHKISSSLAEKYSYSPSQARWASAGLITAFYTLSFCYAYVRCARALHKIDCQNFIDKLPAIIWPSPSKMQILISQITRLRLRGVI